MVEKSRHYVDVNILVYWLGNHPKYGQIALEWVKKMETAQRGEYITSALTLYQTLVVIGGLTGRNLKDKNFVEQVINPITRIKGLSIEPLKPEDYKKATELMNEFKLDYEDCLHLAVAITTGANQIISNDKDFDTTKTKRIV